ncbi:hypothetical protein MA16_Dca006919 [Dendrobium catenatum]|uniref:Uncharacterized protein n=1 Tax=Dendrobium catenatum TaxID=906689 RepID=A0A2I0VT64_9ASPA|nr:hypothetical protein MA16_Dca006919 [Dendrobium catenatum]
MASKRVEVLETEMGQFKTDLEEKMETLSENVEEKFIALKEMMKKLLEGQARAVSAEERGKGSGSKGKEKVNPEEEEEVELLDSNGRMPPRESIRREEYDRRRDFREGREDDWRFLYIQKIVQSIVGQGDGKSKSFELDKSIEQPNSQSIGNISYSESNAMTAFPECVPKLPIDASNVPSTSDSSDVAVKKKSNDGSGLVEQNAALHSNAVTAENVIKDDTLEEGSIIAVNNSFNALVELEEGELLESLMVENLGE